MDGNLAMNSHEDNMSEKDSQDAYQEFIIKERFPINDEWDDIDKIYAKGQRDGARWMDSYLTDFADKKKAELLLMKKDIAFKAWKAAANAFRLYPNNKHTFFDYWSVEEKGGPTENNYYPGISYQRLFNQINESGLNPTISQMTDIIYVVKEDFKEEKQPPYLGKFGTVGIVYNFNQPEIKKQVNCELLAIYKDGRIVVQCYDIHGEKWESETFSRIEFFTPKN